MSGDQDAFERLRYSAAQAAAMLQRVGGGVLEGVASGRFGARVTARHASDLADLVQAATEHVRYLRAQIGEADGDPDPFKSTNLPVVQMIDTKLPLNRKERFFTATVLPMLIGSDGFAHLNRFLRLCGVEDAAICESGRSGAQPFQFFTEYSFAESVFTPAERERFAGHPELSDVPDLFLAGEDWLLAVEAKMFHKPSSASLNDQVRRQRALVSYLAEALGIATERTHHVLLLPAEFHAHGVDAPVVSWEDVLSAYEVVGPLYWSGILRTALDSYHDRVSRGPEFGSNKDSSMTGSEIVAAARAGDTTYSYMGRAQGLTGTQLAADIASGDWRARSYEVRSNAIEARNWFHIAAFVELVADE